MECKFITVSQSAQAYRELIDTLWNVNVFVTVLFLSLLIELIDTLWNVNTDIMYKKEDVHTGINRYIMECK